MNSPDYPHPDYSRLEERVARLEATCEYILEELREIKADMREMRRDMVVDFRILFGAIIAVAVGLTGIMAKGFGWI